MTTGMLRLLGIACLVAIIVLSLLTGDLKVRTPIPGALTHLMAYAGTGGLLAALYRDGPSRMRILVGLAATAFCLELAQWPLPGRDSSITDFLISTAGACLGTGAIRFGEWLTDRIPQD